jgi:hypothetical protein
MNALTETTSLMEPRSSTATPQRRDGPSITGFFRYHGIWAPGVRFFRRVSFPVKAVCITLTLLIPLAVLSWGYFTNQAAQIEFSSKERAGVACCPCWMRPSTCAARPS